MLRYFEAVIKTKDNQEVTDYSISGILEYQGEKTTTTTTTTKKNASGSLRKLPIADHISDLESDYQNVRMDRLPNFT